MSPRLFRFAVIADSHVNPSDEDQISPYESHRLTNTRLAHTVDVLNALSPDFTVHVGDMIHPVPEAVSYPDAVARFKAAVGRLNAPLHLVPGNHDVGDKHADYVPAGEICQPYVELYQRHFGEHFYAFDHGDCHFVVINTSLINSGLEAEARQARWLEDDLRANAGRRTLLFVHYPPFIASADEHGHYDNIDEPGRSWLLGLVAQHQLAAVFTGHVHNFFFNAHAGTPIFSLPSTAFVRGDYSELFAVGQPPEHENGRNDVSKLGVLVVDVYEDRLVPQFIRTHDRPEGAAPSVQRDWPQLPPAADAPGPGLGLDLRYHWGELHQIPYSSMLDEFRRKQARNDYPILALWEMGIRHLRVPLDDLIDPASRVRMAALAALGSRFTVFLFGWPTDEQIALLREHRHLLRALELIVKWPLAPDLGDRLDALRTRVGVPLHVSRFWSASGQSRDGKQIKLLVDHGFAGAADPAARELLEATRGRGVNALVFRVAADTPFDEGIADVAEFASRHGVRAQVHVRLASDSPAQARHDAQVNGVRALGAAFASRGFPQADVFLDTLSDVDRGYFPRAGLVDRRFNPKREGQALRNLHGALSELPALDSPRWVRDPQFLVGTARVGQSVLMLVLPLGGGALMQLPDWLNTQGLRVKRWLDLASGEERAWPDADPDSAKVLEGACLIELMTSRVKEQVAV